MKKLQTYFWLAIIIHLLLLTSVAFNFAYIPPSSEKEFKELPAYIYHEKINQPQVTPQPPSPTPAKNPPEDVSPNGIKKSEPPKKPATKQTTPVALSLGTGTQNININEKSTAEQPLLRLLSKATAAHLVYPKIAYDFRLRGNAIVEFMLHPDGHLTGVGLLKSSGSAVLDNAALAAIKGISPVKGVEQYVKEPQTIAFRIIFG